MAIWFGGKVHGADASASTKWRQVPVCGVKTKAIGRTVTSAITCVKCKTKLGMQVEESERPVRVVRAADGWLGWTSAGPGVYTAQVPSKDGVIRQWRLERQPYSPDDHYLLLGGGWYLFGPEGVVFGEPMYTQDGDTKLAAALAAADAYLGGRPRPQTAG
jgi:hypothetical protein